MIIPVIRTNNEIRSLADDEFSFFIDVPENKGSHILIRTSQPVVIRSRSGRPFKYNSDLNEITMGSGQFNFVKGITDEIIIKGKDYIKDFTLGVDNGTISGFENLDLPQPREIIITKAKGVSLRNFAASTISKLMLSDGGDGDIKSLSLCQNLKELGLNHTNITGDISYLPSSLTFLSLYFSCVYGNVNSLKCKDSLEKLSLSESEVDLNLSHIKEFTRLSLLDCGAGVVKGDLSNLLNLTALTTVSLGNKQQPDLVFGDLGKLPSNVTSVEISTSNALVYTTHKTWAPNMKSVKVRLKESQQIDDLITDLSNTTWTSGGTFEIKGGYRTSSSDSAVQKLISYGVKVNL